MNIGYLSIIEKALYVGLSFNKEKAEVIGTIELFQRNSHDYFTECGLLDLDLRSDYENEVAIKEILSLIISPTFELFKCNKIATKAFFFFFFFSIAKETKVCILRENRIFII